MLWFLKLSMCAYSLALLVAGLRIIYIVEAFTCFLVSVVRKFIAILYGRFV